jgi:thiol peroxidase
MAENGLLARAVFVVNPAGEILYDEYVDEVTQEPDYDKALEAAGVKK